MQFSCRKPNLFSASLKRSKESATPAACSDAAANTVCGMAALMATASRVIADAAYLLFIATPVFLSFCLGTSKCNCFDFVMALRLHDGHRADGRRNCGSPGRETRKDHPTRVSGLRRDSRSLLLPRCGSC